MNRPTETHAAESTPGNGPECSVPHAVPIVSGTEAARGREACASESLPAPLLIGLVLIAGLTVFTGWDQSHWWRVKEDYGFGWLVPFFVAFMVRDRWPSLVRGLYAGGDTQRPGGGRVAIVMAVAVLSGGAGLFLLGALYRAAAGPSYSGTLAITLGMAAVALASIFLLAPSQATSPGGDRVDRLAIAGLFVFPAAVWLISAPMITVVENNLNVFLMRQITTVVFFIFDLLGFALEQKGNVLILPHGSVGVAEACSGIRSLTGCLFAGSFLAAVYLASWWHKAALMIAALVFAVGANLLRSLFLTSWAYARGAQSIEGTVHDLSGYAVLGLTVLALILVLSALGSHKPRAAAG